MFNLYLLLGIILVSLLFYFFGVNNANKKLAPIGTHLLFIAKNIERVADYVTDIAEQIYFLVNGKMLSDHRPKADETSLKIPE